MPYNANKKTCKKKLTNTNTWALGLQPLRFEHTQKIHEHKEHTHTKKNTIKIQIHQHLNILINYNSFH